MGCREVNLDRRTPLFYHITLQYILQAAVQYKLYSYTCKHNGHVYRPFPQAVLLQFFSEQSIIGIKQKTLGKTLFRVGPSGPFVINLLAQWLSNVIVLKQALQRQTDIVMYGFV